MRKNVLIYSLVFCCTFYASNAQESLTAQFKLLEASTVKKSDKEKLDFLSKTYFDYQLKTFPELCIYYGIKGDNTRWTDWSKEAISQRKKDNALFVESINGINRAILDKSDRLNYDLLKTKLEENKATGQFWGELMPIDKMSGQHQNIVQVIAFTNIKTEKDAMDLNVRLEKIPLLIDQLIMLMEEGREKKIMPSKISLLGVTEQIENMINPDPSKSILLTNYLQYTESVTTEKKKKLNDLIFRSITDKVNPSLQKLKSYLKNSYIPDCRESYGLSELANGENWYNSKVKSFTTTDLTYREIHETGLKEVKRIRAEMDAIIKSTGFKGSFEAFNIFLKTDPQFFYESGEELLNGYRIIAKKIDPQLPKLFGKLPRLPYGVEPVPAFDEKDQTTAYYYNGSLETGRPGVFYANTYNLKSRPKWEMEALTIHEAMPGHHLQIALAQEMENVPDFRKYIDYTAFVEGWGLYSESLGPEMGLYKDPYSKYGQLSYEMWRAIRLVVDAGIHGMGWTRQQALDYFIANSPKSVHDITVEIDRYITWPGQALAYKIGELKIKELRKKAMAELGDKFNIREFHDAVLENGAIPLSILENQINEWILLKKK